MSTRRAEKKGRRPGPGERLAQHALMASLFLLALYLIGHMRDGLPVRDRPTASVALRRAREYVAFVLSQHMQGGPPDAQGISGDCQPIVEDAGQFRCQGAARPRTTDGRRVSLSWQCLMLYQDQEPPWHCIDLFMRLVEGGEASRADGAKDRRGDVPRP